MVAVLVFGSGCGVEEGAGEFRDLADDPDYSGWEGDGGGDEPADSSEEPEYPSDWPPPGCCEAFDCNDGASRPDAGLCGDGFSMCEALEECCDQQIKGCFPPDKPSACNPYDDLKADGHVWWEAHFEEIVDVGPIKFPYNQDAWPLSTAVVAVAGTGFRVVAAAATPVMVFLDLVEASQTAINNADDGVCQCLSGREMRGNAWSATQSDREEVYCWRATDDPDVPGARTCQTEFVYTECEYEDAPTGTGRRPVLENKDFKCDCGIHPSPCTWVPDGAEPPEGEDDRGARKYCCAEASLNACRCNEVGSQYPDFVTCVPNAQIACTLECSPYSTDCRHRDDVLACHQVDFVPYAD